MVPHLTTKHAAAEEPRSNLYSPEYKLELPQEATVKPVQQTHAPAPENRQTTKKTPKFRLSNSSLQNVKTVTHS